MKEVWSLISGLIFGLGLMAGGMTDPSKVKGFLDLFGRWDPSLALVMAGGIGVGYFAFKSVRNKAVCWTGAPFETPEAQQVDRSLIIGGILFGAGWGVAGFCPGPAVVALGSGSLQAAVFVAAMVLGMAVHDRWKAHQHQPVSQSCG